MPLDEGAKHRPATFELALSSPKALFSLLSEPQVASTHSDSFNSLLDAYEQLGESMPQLLQYQTMDKDPQMAKVLSLLFEDILDFHLQALKQFRQRSK